MIITGFYVTSPPTYTSHSLIINKELFYKVLKFTISQAYKTTYINNYIYIPLLTIDVVSEVERLTFAVTLSAVFNFVADLLKCFLNYGKYIHGFRKRLHILVNLSSL